MPTLPLLIVYCFLILLASIAGGLVPLYIQLTHRRMEIAVSFVAGVMLGVGLMHLLGHAIEDISAPPTSGSIDGAMLWLLIGVLAMFFSERFFCYHHHSTPDSPHGGSAVCDHGHEMTWTGAAVGLTLHSIVNGVALAAAVEHDAEVQKIAFTGLSTFLVIVLHKPFDAMTIGTLMAKGGWSPRSRHVVNGLFALAIPIGVLIFYLGVLQYAPDNSPALPYALAFSAGTFLCIAMSDILPELQFHRHDRVMLTVSLFLGLAVAWVIALVEMGQHHVGHGG